MKVDILHTHSSLDSWIAGMAARLAGTKKIIRTRHVSIPVSNKWVYTWLADGVITTGETIKKHIIDRCGVDANTVYSIPTGIDLAQFVPEKYKDQPLRKELGLA